MSAAQLVSIIIPAYNAEAFIETAVNSVLAQEGAELEVIVVDDGSSDRTAALASRFGHPVTCVRQANRGAPAARNVGVALARGEYIGFLDSDDVREPGAIQLQLEKLQQAPHVDIVVGRAQRETLVSGTGEPSVFKPLEATHHLTLHLGASLLRRSVWDRVGPFDEALLHCEDWDWFMRAREMQVGMLLHQDFVMRQRLHESNITRDRDAGRHYLSMMLKRSLNRRRQSDGRAESLPSLSKSFESLAAQAESE